MAESKLIAVVRIRGGINVKGEIVDTMKMLHLHRKNFCSVHKDTFTLKGQLQKVKDYVTYGVITAEDYEKLKKARGEKDTNKEGALKPFFRLHPPKGGFERKGTKKPFSLGGALGDRKDKIGLLISRMLGN